MSNLALLCQESGRLDESEKRNREVLDLRRQVFGEDHPAVINTLANLADVLRAKGDLEQAEIMFRRLTEVDRRVLGEKHPTLAVHLFSLSSLIGKKGDYLQAEKLLRESVAINEASLPPDHWQTLTSKIGLGACLVRLGRFEEAEPILIAGQAAIQGKPEVPEHWQVSAVTYLVRLYEGWDAKSPNTGKAEKAAQWRARLPATSSPATTNKS
ncbi:MAG TPA: tetratricopeptide repeat protein, partial [Phycisphaerae bacterium]|nr:tetratricopeptide repeat protein [Phycisphaerae bacterium]